VVPILRRRQLVPSSGYVKTLLRVTVYESTRLHIPKDRNHKSLFLIFCQQKLQPGNSMEQSPGNINCCSFG